MTAPAFSLKLLSMTEEILTAVFETKDPIAKNQGRKADLCVAVISGLMAGLSLIAAIWFFSGFAENDTRPEHLFSALVLTLGLFSFAIIPFSIVSYLAKRAYRDGAKRAHLLWTVFLMIPWIVLGSLASSHTPLPIWCGIIITLVAIILSLWALISLFLDRQSTA